MVSAAAPAAVAAAADAASDLNHLLQPLHWTAVLRHPRGAARSPLCFRLCTIVMTALILSFFISEVTVLYREGTDDLTAFTMTLGVADTNIIWLFRMVHITLCERAFHKLALQVGNDFAEFLTLDDIPMLRSQSRAVRRFTLIYIWFGIGAVVYYLFSPVSDEGLPVILAVPFDAKQPLGFAVTWIYVSIVTMHVVVMTMVFDSFNVSIIAQLRIQLTLLNSKLVNLAKEMSERPVHSSKTPAYRELHYRLEKCVRHHQAIIKNADLLEKSLGAMLLAQSLAIGACACFQMFQVATKTPVIILLTIEAGFVSTHASLQASVNLFDPFAAQNSTIFCSNKMNKNGLQETGKFGCHLTVMLAELFEYCWFGDDLITESENVALAAYDAVTSLLECPVSIKRSLLLVMQRAQRPLCITAGGFFPLSRESFVSVVNVSYSFFAILRNFKNEEE